MREVWENLFDMRKSRVLAPKVVYIVKFIEWFGDFSMIFQVLGLIIHAPAFSICNSDGYSMLDLLTQVRG